MKHDSVAGGTVNNNDQLVGLENLANTPTGGDAPSNSIPLTLNMDLADGGWETVLTAVAAADKYVALDLSACTMTGTEFDPRIGATEEDGAIGTPKIAGVDKITTLVLPNTAKSVKAGMWTDPPFKAFTSLESLSGAGIETISAYTFCGCANLTEVTLPLASVIDGYAFDKCKNLRTASLPLAATIGEAAFSCTSLTEMDLPVATTVGAYAFSFCTNLTCVNLSSATTIGDYAFDQCASLTEANFPATATIGDYTFRDCANLIAVNLPLASVIGESAFRDCASLTEMNLPAVVTVRAYAFVNCAGLISASLPLATSVSDSAFYGCESLRTVNLSSVATVGVRAFCGCASLTEAILPATPPSIKEVYFGVFYSTGAGAITVKVPTGAVSAYTSAWGVDAETPKDGNTDAYGFNHKAVIITDAAQ
ncbi:MAG: leucine-rich repeat domain-containing protein [Treponema sp.]|jgi:hypothetical protein|nr:leucine-rich repeat domain-containing protein [Treponema sp.]